MADEDLTRAGGRPTRHSRHAGDRPDPASAGFRSAAPPPGQTRSALRRLARARQRRRWAVEGLTVLACVSALVAYLGSPGGGPGEETTGGVPAGVGRPSGPPGLEGRAPSTGPASPGLRPRQRPPSPSPTPSASPTPTRPAPVLLTLGMSEVPDEVDLTAVGTRDWVHWGLRGADSTVRKRGGSGEIRDDGGRGTRGDWDANEETFGWRDGTPVNSADDAAEGVYTCGAGNGFALAVVGSGEPRTVRLYAGVWMARGRLDVRLSGGGPTRTLRMEDPHTSRSAEFTVRFQAPKGSRLVLSWTVEHAFGDDCGSVGVQALALR